MVSARKNQLVPLTIEGYSSDGDGVARLDGMAVFVKGALRGEECLVRLLKVGRSAAWGRVEEVRAPSPARQSPDCPHFPQCGGCALRHMSYAEELEFKRQKVEDALKRIGGLELPVTVIHGAPCPDRYRNKAQFPVSGATQSGIRIGFFRARSHDVIDVPSCLLQRPEADAAGRAVKAWMENFDVSAYDEKKHAGLVRHVYVRTNRSGESLICLLCNGRKLPHEEELVQALRAAVPKAVGVVLGVNQDKTNVILGKEYRTLWGQDFLYDTLCGLSFQLSVPSFFQVNPEQTEVLYQKAAEFAGLTGRETVVDLYCGTGTISLVLARQAGQVIGAEIVPSAVEDAKENARRNGITNAEFICADAGEAAAELSRRGLRPDVICVDPPRKGMAEEVIGHIAAMAPRRVVYVSCDPATLARDCRRFAERGYQAVRVEAVDMFPRTKHVETVVLLSKGEIDSKKVRVEFSLEDMDMSGFQKGATYEQIKAYVLKHTGLKVSSLYISQVKRKCGLDVGQNYNLSKKEDAKVPQCPPEKEAAIMEALKHFQMLE